MSFKDKFNFEGFWAIEENKDFKRFTIDNTILSLSIAAAYFGWFFGVVQFRVEHWILFYLVVSLYYFNRVTRSFCKSMFPFAIFWVFYDSMRLVPNYTVNHVHIQEVYNLDKYLFGIYDNGVKISLNEYLSKYHKPIFDFLSGFFYINWIPVPFLFGVFAFIKDKLLVYSFANNFLFVNLLGFCFFYIYPAAPPWYVAEYGFVENFDMMGNMGNLKYFDAIVGKDIFKGLYQINANVFASMPSLHSAYPLIVLYYAMKLKNKWITFGFSFFCVGIWCSAVYSNHHYVIDVIGGIACAMLSIFLFNLFLKKPMVKYIMPL